MPKTTYKPLKEMPLKYDHHLVEQGKYQYWLDNHFFDTATSKPSPNSNQTISSGDISKTPYTIVIPPPNVTGKLHLGHAWDTTLQDIIIRQKRMEGYDTLYLPGMDHAGIATQAKIDAKLRQMGTNRYQLGRSKFLEVAWSWKEEYAQIIRDQWSVLGLSLDYSRERFTLDEGLNQAVNKVFIQLYQEGLIYRGERIINWDVQSKTALSNIEVEYKDINGAFYHLLYPLTDGSGYLEIATTRPETMFGDTALMVHPQDQRYQAYIGKKVYIPNTTTQIPVISDEYVDREFGTGVVKVTPAHDPNDFEVGNRHNLPRILCMNEDGTMNQVSGKYVGLDRFDCRKQVVADLQAAGLCPKIEPMVHSVGHSERTGVIVEPRLSKQWFVKMETLASDVLDMQKGDQKITFVPERFEKTFQNWLEDTQDWCISRQLWWGHRIPAWYKDDQVIVSVTSPGDDWVQDPDVLDTWFSSALWPFSTLGWPEDSEDLKRYFPTDCLVTGYDIIFFWVARMAFQSRHFQGQRPFKKCLIHGLIRDEQGRKMSKSLGNGVDPFEVIEAHGCDALRYFLTTNSTPGQDLRYSTEKLTSSWNYINKIWNISRFIKMNLDKYYDQFGEFTTEIDPNYLNEYDQWILNRLNKVIEKVNSGYESFEFGEVAKTIYNFVWDDFASWYLEFTKAKLNNLTNQSDEVVTTLNVLRYSLINVLKLLHPFMPFITEEIYQYFEEGSIMISSWPQVKYDQLDTEKVDLVNTIIEIIYQVRNIRAEKNIVMSKPLNISLEVNPQNLLLTSFLTNQKDLLKRLINYQQLVISNPIDKKDALVKVLDQLNIIVPVAELINREEELARLSKEQIRLNNEIQRATNMLNNPNFINKAPEDKVNSEREKLVSYQNQLVEVEKLLAELK